MARAGGAGLERAWEARSSACPFRGLAPPAHSIARFRFASSVVLRSEGQEGSGSLAALANTPLQLAGRGLCELAALSYAGRRLVVDAVAAGGPHSLATRAAGQLSGHPLYSGQAALLGEEFSLGAVLGPGLFALAVEQLHATAASQPSSLYKGRRRRVCAPRAAGSSSNLVPRSGGRRRAVRCTAALPEPACGASGLPGGLRSGRSSLNSHCAVAV